MHKEGIKMDEELATLEKLVETARRLCLKSVSIAGVSLELLPEKPAAEAVGSLPETNGEPMPADDEMLYASSPFYDVLKIDREGTV